MHINDTTSTCINIVPHIINQPDFEKFLYIYYVNYHAYTYRYFSTVRSVLQGACHMVAMQIACEPLVRQVLRQVYQTRGMVNVCPTKKGRKVFHCNICNFKLVNL